MADISAFADAVLNAFAATGIIAEQCDFDPASGQLIIKGEAARVVPLAALFPRYAACQSDSTRASFVEEIAEVFVSGAADIPYSYPECGLRLLPQLWPVDKIAARQATLPSQHQLPHCGMHGEDSPLQPQNHSFGVILVCECSDSTRGSSSGMPPIETPVLSSDLARWSKNFVEVLQDALDNLRARTKAGPPAEKRWEHHESGCGQSCWQDRFDAARCALLPKLVALRKRTDGLSETGGHVAVFATSSCVLASTSKNALGLCFMGDTVHLKIVPDDEKRKGGQILSAKAYRLLKAKADSSKSHPLLQQASEGFVWKWLPYAPGGPPMRSPGEFSVPVDQGEVDAILNAVEAGRSIPVFTVNVDQEKADALFATFKDKANAFFKAGDYLKAIATYDRALDLKPSPSDKDAAILHANAAQALLNLAAADESDKKEGCAAEAMRRAMLATQLDPGYAKGHARVAAACDILGEPAAAKEARDKAAACTAVANAAEEKAKAAKKVEADEKKRALEVKKAAEDRAREEAAHREALLERERAAENERQDSETAQALNSMLGFKDTSLAGVAR